MIDLVIFCELLFFSLNVVMELKVLNSVKLIDVSGVVVEKVMIFVLFFKSLFGILIVLIIKFLVVLGIWLFCLKC